MADVKRRRFIEMYQCCWICRAYGTQCHEICQGVNRHEAILHPENYLALCGGCHAGVHQSKKEWPVERQVALKYMKSAYLLEDILECVNRMGIKTVYECDVKDYLTFIR